MRANKKGMVLVGIFLMITLSIVACSNAKEDETKDSISKEQSYEELCDLAIAKAEEGDYESAVAYCQEARILSNDAKALELDYIYRKVWAAEQLEDSEFEAALENYRYLRGLGASDIDEEVIRGEVAAHLSMGNAAEAMDVIDYALKYADDTEPFKKVKQDIIDHTIILKKTYCYLDGTEIPGMVEEYSYDKENFVIDENGMEYYYDENGNCIKQVQRMDNQILYTIEMEYDFKGDKVSQRYLDADGNVTSSSTYTYEYDADDRLLSVWENNPFLFAEPMQIEKCTYDQTGALIEHWIKVEKPEIGYYGYDQWYYDSFGNCIQADGETYKYVYKYMN